LEDTPLFSGIASVIAKLFPRKDAGIDRMPRRHPDRMLLVWVDWMNRYANLLLAIITAIYVYLT
jgi:hypothetical protein